MLCFEQTQWGYACVLLGLTPLARGTAIFFSNHGNCCRITPACAGNSQLDEALGSLNGDHPRLRGEQLVCTNEITWRGGSPPLARGTVFLGFRPRSVDRITPACAGNRLSFHRTLRHTRDHPRLRGEQLPSSLNVPPVGGSPPLARGTEPVDYIVRVYFRITPACAGNRNKIIPLSPKGEDHPRLRGEQQQHSAIWLCTPGSPPLARGTGINKYCIADISGITPACAGNSGLRC